MKNRFYAPDSSDKRIIYAANYLKENGYIEAESAHEANFVLLGVNPDKKLLDYPVPIFAGNIAGNGIYDYTKQESFAITNAYLTAEAAVALAVNECRKSLINASVMLLGFGRIGKALLRYLSVYTNDICVCVRSSEAAALAKSLCAKVTGFEALKQSNRFDVVFNTVPHAIMGKEELSALNGDALIIDLASFPGGVDVHFAKHLGLKLIQARGLPAKVSPESAGIAVGEAVEKMTKEVIA